MEDLDSEENIILGGDFNCLLNPAIDKHGGVRIRVYLGVRTCELFLCFVPFVFLDFIVLTSLFSLLYVTGEFNRFLHRAWMMSP